MTLVAFYFVFINMRGVHQVSVLKFLQSLPFSVAFETILPWNFPVPDNGVVMAFIATEPIIEDHGVVESGRWWPNENFLRMTVVAVIDPGIMFAFFKMTDETGTLSDGDVLSLNDLGMTACALELFTSFEVFEVDFVVERHFVELDDSFQEPFFVAAFPQATVISYFCPGFGFDIQFCPVAADHDQPFDFDSQLGSDTASRWIMTNAAFDIFMR